MSAATALKRLAIDCYVPQAVEALVALHPSYRLINQSELVPMQNLIFLTNETNAPLESVIALLQNILLYLKMSPDLCCVAVLDASGSVPGADLLKVVNPRCVISFGEQPESISLGNIHQVSSVDLGQALKNPMLKEQILRDVNELSL